ncbi:hypothetical protein ZWY2020_048715 [Hordeum vulgare]|nr:hypothetical protein ZWY2020_048715 [Hordeum vulgare]
MTTPPLHTGDAPPSPSPFPVAHVVAAALLRPTPRYRLVPLRQVSIFVSICGEAEQRGRAGAAPANRSSGEPEPGLDGEVGKLKGVLEKIKELVEEMNMFGLENSGNREGPQLPWRQTHSKLDESTNIFGRDDDKEGVVKLLLDQQDQQNVQVLPIFEFFGE